jgi:hypothetical protein
MGTTLADGGLTERHRRELSGAGGNSTAARRLRGSSALRLRAALLEKDSGARGMTGDGVRHGELSCGDGPHGEGTWRRGSDSEAASSDRGGRERRRPYTRPNGVRTVPPRPANGSTAHGDRAADRWVPRVSGFLILK